MSRNQSHNSRKVIAYKHMLNVSLRLLSIAGFIKQMLNSHLNGLIIIFLSAIPMVTRIRHNKLINQVFVFVIALLHQKMPQFHWVW